MVKNLISGPILAHLAHIWALNFVGFTSTRCWTLLQAIIVCNSFWTRYKTYGAKFGSPKFFVKNLASTVTRYHGQLSEKTNDPILWKFSDRRTDGQRDESDFIGRCPNNVERRKGVKYVQSLLQRNTRANLWLYCIVNFGHILNFFLVFLLLTLNK